MTTDATLLESVHDAIAERTPIASARLDRLTVGDRLLLVEAEPASGSGLQRAAGVAHRPPGDLGDDPTGDPALDVASWATRPSGSPDGTDSPDLLRRAVGVAALNALSAPLVDWRTGDPFEALAEDVTAIATVGLFGPAFRKFGAVEVRVIERRVVEVPETPTDVAVTVFDPEDAAAAMDGADVAFVTGSTLLYGGTERYLAVAREAGVQDVVLVGSTASFVPEPAFDAGATVLAGARVVDPAGIRARIRDGECATDLHDEGLSKVYATAGRAPAGLDLG